MNPKISKILALIALVSFIVTASSVVSAALIIADLNQKTAKVVAQGEKEVVVNNDQSVLTAAVVATHDEQTDCWMTIFGNVYNLTAFLSSHPGGLIVMAPYCGKDATAAFATKDKNPAVSHSDLAKTMLGDYYVGVLGQPVASSSAVPNLVPSPARPTIVLSAPVPTPTLAVPSVSPQVQTLTSAGVAIHNNPSDCWIIISGKVYNVTNYLVSHPGGVGAISLYCGKEATTAFQTKGGKGSHSQTANNLLANYLVGSVGQTTTVNNPSPVPSSCQGIPASICSKYPGATIIENDTEDNGTSAWKVNTSSGFRDIKLDSSGNITNDKKC